MKNTSKLLVPLAVGVLSLASSQSLQAVVIYDNSVNDLQTRFNPGTLQVGDEINLAGTERMLQTFSFEYYAVNTSGAAETTVVSANAQARVIFYQNNGTPFNTFPTPANSFYDSGWFSINGTTRSTLEFSVANGDFAAGGLFIPASDITWAVQFQGLGAGDQAGLDLYSPPVVGSSFNDYWQNNGTVASPIWELVSIPSTTANFAAKFDATAAPSSVPETFNTFAGLLAGLGMLIGARNLRRNKN